MKKIKKTFFFMMKLLKTTKDSEGEWNDAF